LVSISAVLMLVGACGDDSSDSDKDAGSDAATSGSGGGGSGGRGGRGGSGGTGGRGGSGGTGGRPDAGEVEGGSGGTGGTGGTGGAGGTGGSGGAGGGNAESECGDGVVASDEDCDDDDTDDNDGCDSDCEVESGWLCSGAPSSCARLCGNGELNEGEACDDGDADNNDGCSSCALETNWSCTGAPSTCNKLNANVLIGSQLAALSTEGASGILPGVTLTGIAAGDTLVGIDRRPVNGLLYALGHNATEGTVRLYVISSESAIATPLGAAARFVASDGTTADNVTGTKFGFDFNPGGDRIRVVTDTGMNFRINPNTGGLVDADTGGAAGVQADPDVNGPTTRLDECAYTNNSVEQELTTLYTLNQAADQLYIQNPPNDGTQTVIQTLPTPFEAITGFDIAAGVNTTGGLNPVTSGYGWIVVTPVSQTNSSLARLNLVDGVADMVTPLNQSTLGLAVQNSAAPIVALTAGQGLVRFHATSPLGTTSAATALSGIGGGETLVDIDYRPSNGQLMGLGVNATTNTATLYLVDPDGGGLTPVGTTSGIVFYAADGTTQVDFPDGGWSIDFNPMVDRLRVVNANGINFRVNPETGAAVDSDMTATNTQADGTLSGLTGGANGAGGAAYTNSWAGPTATTLYILDTEANQICRSSNPNGGNVTGCFALTSGSQPFDAPSGGEIDFAADVRVGTSNDAASGVVHAVLSVSGNAHLYSIDVATGAVTDAGQVGTGFDFIGLAVGHATIR
jgi:cysteine-rich repeat protein